MSTELTCLHQSYKCLGCTEIPHWQLLIEGRVGGEFPNNYNVILNILDMLIVPRKSRIKLW
jgi:hypothetical protein